MYERSAIVLERYFEEKLGLNKRSNLKINYENFRTIIEEMQNYQTIIKEEEQVIKEFDTVAKEIQSIQKTQERFYKLNQKLEDDRNRLFNTLDEDPQNLEKKLDQISENIIKNNEEMKSLKVNFITFVTEFIEKQSERNKYTKSRRLVEANNMNNIERATKDWKEIEEEIIKSIKETALYDENIEEQLSKIMINNGKDEKVGFNEGVIQQAIKARLDIAREEGQCYVIVYDRMRRLLQEIENDNVKIVKYQKFSRDIYVKLKFLSAKKDYITRFLDNERMTAINGATVHKQMMEEACQNFEADIAQIDNLYELILKEIAGKATKKSYKELYNKTYLKEIEEKEKNFEQEVNRIRITGTIINSNYWRIEGIKNIYETFLKEVSENFDKDLSEYTLEQVEPEKSSIDEFEVNEPVQEDSKIKHINIYDDEDDFEDEEDEEDDFEESEDEDEDDDYEYDDEDDKIEESKTKFEKENKNSSDKKIKNTNNDDIEFDEYDDDDIEFDEEDDDDDFIEFEKSDKKERKDKKEDDDDDDDEIYFKDSDDDKEDKEETDDDDTEFDDSDIGKEILKNFKYNQNRRRKNDSNIFGKIFKDKKKR